VDGLGTNRACRRGRKSKGAMTSILNIYEENSKNKTHRLAHVENKTMLVEAYKVNDITRFMYNDNVISAASTHGDQRAIEVYLRAMVKQFDYTQCVKYRCEWAFHNYLYYMGVLWSIPEIDQVRVHMQGTGAVNSVGEDIPLNSSRIYVSDSHIVNNLPMGYGKHPSWCVHQYKADEELYAYINETKKSLVAEVNYEQPPAFGNHGELLGENYTSFASPLFGKHRREEDAIFSTVKATNLNDLVLFVLSARNAGFQGDIVLHTPLLDQLSVEIQEFLKALGKQEGIVVYAGVARHQDHHWSLTDFYLDPSTGTPITDPRPPRAMPIVAWELFRAWSKFYAPSSSIMILDGEVSYFQRNPVVSDKCRSFELHLHFEYGQFRRFSNIKEQDKNVANAIESIFPPDDLIQFATESLINPKAIYGHQESVSILISDMIKTIDSFKCYSFGCDWAVLNYLWFTKKLSIYDSISYQISTYRQGGGQIHITYPGLSFMTEKKLYNSTTKLFQNWKGTVSPVVFRYKYHELDDMFDKTAKELLSQMTGMKQGKVFTHGQPEEILESIK